MGRPRQLVLPGLEPRRRSRAGRKKGPRPGVWHRARSPITPRHPLHVTLRLAGTRRDLRTPEVRLAFRGVLSALQAARADFRVVAFSLQTNHAHLFVEAD